MSDPVFVFYSVFLLIMAAFVAWALFLSMRPEPLPKPFDARKTALVIRRKFKLSKDAVVPMVFVLGTGWGDTVKLECEQSVALRKLPGFRQLLDHPTHQRRLCFGYMEGKAVFVMRGRIHMNETPNSTELANMVRLQIEMFRYLGAKRFVLTSAVGGLLRGHGPGDQQAKTGHIGVVDGFVTLFAPDMPLYGGEFVAVENCLDPELRRLAGVACVEVGLESFEGGHVMVRGPQFEGTKYDKRVLAETGAKIVGMSILPEACVATLWGAKVLAVCFVSNDDAEAHSDELVRARTQAASDKLGAMLKALIKQL